MTYEIEYAKSTKKDFRKLSSIDRARIVKAIDKLADTPRPAAALLMKGTNAWRLRVGNHRVIYDIYDDRLVILVLEIGHRREVYR